MGYLIFVSLLWGFSFGLIKSQLSGLDANFVSFVRMALALLVFLPWLKLKRVPHKTQLLVIGAVQFGFMYIVYILSYHYLQAYQVALFTIFTPIYVSLLNDLLQRKFNTIHLAAALISVLGTWIIVWNQALDKILWIGFGLVQISNLCFAFGQILYRKYRGKQTRLIDEVHVFALLYLGAVVVTGAATLVTTDLSRLNITAGQWLTFGYLGIVASGLGFFLWNFGATKVNAGALAIFNNLKIPLAILVTLLFFGEHANGWRLLIGGTIVIGALWFNEQIEWRRMKS